LQVAVKNLMRLLSPLRRRINYILLRIFFIVFYLAFKKTQIIGINIRFIEILPQMLTKFRGNWQGIWRQASKWRGNREGAVEILLTMITKLPYKNLRVAFMPCGVDLETESIGYRHRRWLRGSSQIEKETLKKRISNIEHRTRNNE
jgi:hypothetical protein